MASTPVLQNILNAQQPSNASGGNGVPSYSSQLQNILSGNIPTNTSPNAGGISLKGPDQGIYSSYNISALSQPEQLAIGDLAIQGRASGSKDIDPNAMKQAISRDLSVLGIGAPIDWSNYPELQKIMQQDQSQGTTALGNYMTAQQAKESQFINPMEAPKNDQFSITNSLSGNSPTNQIMSQYENQYNTAGNQLATEKQTFINNLNQTQSQVTSELQQLTSPQALQAFVYGTTGNSIIGALYPMVQTGALPLSEYQQMTTSFTDVAANNLNFTNSYNNLFQNFLGLNINLNDQINALKDMINTVGGQGSLSPTQSELQSAQTQQQNTNAYNYLTGQGMSPTEANQTVSTDPNILSNYNSYTSNVGA